MKIILIPAVILLLAGCSSLPKLSYPDGSNRVPVNTKRSGPALGSIGTPRMPLRMRNQPLQLQVSTSLSSVSGQFKSIAASNELASRYHQPAEPASPASQKWTPDNLAIRSAIALADGPGV